MRTIVACFGLLLLAIGDSKGKRVRRSSYCNATISLIRDVFDVRRIITVAYRSSFSVCCQPSEDKISIHLLIKGPDQKGLTDCYHAKQNQSVCGKTEPNRSFWKIRNASLADAGNYTCTEKLRGISGEKAKATITIRINPNSNHEANSTSGAIDSEPDNSTVSPRFTPSATPAISKNTTNLTPSAIPTNTTNSTATQETSRDLTAVIVVSVVVCVVVLTFVLTFILWVLWKHSRRCAWTDHSNLNSHGSKHHNTSSGILEKFTGIEEVNLNNWIVPNACLQLEEQIGEGCFSTVKLATAKEIKGASGPIKVAIKTLGKNNEVDLSYKLLFEELELSLNLRQHRNVVSIYGFCPGLGITGLPGIVMEYAEHGDLRTYLRKLSGIERCCRGFNSPLQTSSLSGVDELQKVEYSLHIAKGMEYLASKNCIHRDLAARNVLVFEGDILKISDFGMAKHIGCSEYYRKKTQGVVPFKWCAPEVLIYKIYSERSDIWAFGIVLWEIATMGGSPYPGIPIEKLYELLTSSSSYRMKKPRGASQRQYEIMLLCWNEVPDRRPSFSQVVKCITTAISELKSLSKVALLKTETKKI